MNTQFMPYVWWSLGLALGAGIFALAIGQLNKSLVPQFRSLQHASSERHARNVLMEWQAGKQVGLAIAAAMLDAICILLLLTAVEVLLIPMLVSTEPTQVPNQESVEAIALALNWLLNFLVMAGLGFAIFANFLADGAILIMLAKGKTYGLLVGLVRITGWFKYGMMAIAFVYLIFRGELYLYRFLSATIEDHHWKTIGVLSAAMVLLAFLVARRLTVFSQQHPPLLALQLASDRLMAKGILARWGKRGRASAARTLGLQIGLALLYGVTIATLCREVGEHIEAEGLKTTAQAMAWLVIIAAACHVGQNLGALAAVYRGDMGWWVGPMRRTGKVRMFFLALVAAYFIGLLIRLEWTTLGLPAAMWIADNAPEIPLPWSDE